MKKEDEDISSSGDLCYTRGNDYLGKVEDVSVEVFHYSRNVRRDMINTAEMRYRTALSQTNRDILSYIPKIEKNASEKVISEVGLEENTCPPVSLLHSLRIRYYQKMFKMFWDKFFLRLFLGGILILTKTQFTVFNVPHQYRK
jgi:hypothetical protein